MELLMTVGRYTVGCVRSKPNIRQVRGVAKHWMRRRMIIRFCAKPWCTTVPADTRRCLKAGLPC
ncbi:hypothetical protein X741_21485 [Mesorhizobium sp. LNHC229A00]|nr:hypothetical protein X741_21485 [Mesorhizobium sp. LNHC229A00]